MKIIDGRKIRDQIIEKISKEVLFLPAKPVFCDVLVGNDSVSTQYVGLKKKMAEKAGFDVIVAEFPEDISTNDLCKEIEKLNRTPNISGLIVQLPVPRHIDKKIILDAVDPRLDVDCMNSKNLELFYAGKPDFSPPTALAIIKILETLSLDMKSLEILVLGQGELVGRPTSFLLESGGYSIMKADINTKNTDELIKKADVIISAIGKPKFIKSDMIKKGSIIIDAGTAEENGMIFGDADFDSVSKIASYISPVPGGVGPVTVAMLLGNVLKSAKLKVKSF